MKLLSIQSQNQPLYFMVALGSAFLIFAALGPGLTSGIYEPFNWRYGVFEMLCHQDPQRSYFINGNAMAVCSRCTGFYFSLFFGWILMPLVAKLPLFSEDFPKKFLIATVSINFIDVAGNYFNFWANTLHSRLILGFFLGFSIALFLTGEFFKHHKSED